MPFSCRIKEEELFSGAGCYGHFDVLVIYQQDVDNDHSVLMMIRSTGMMIR